MPLRFVTSFRDIIIIIALHTQYTSESERAR